MRKLVGLIGIAFALGLVVSGSASAHEAPAADEQTTRGPAERDLTADQYAAVVATRSTFGLPADSATVDRLVADPKAWERSGGLGVPLDEGEPAIVRTRSAIMPETADLSERAEAVLGARFAGVWADVADGHNVVAVTEPASPEETDEITAEASQPVWFVLADFSLEELRAGNGRSWPNDVVGRTGAWSS